MKILSKDKKHTKVTLEEKGVLREEAPAPESQQLPVPHRVSA